MNEDGDAGRGRRGAALFAAQRYELAIPVLREELAATPNDVPLLNLLANSLLMTGQPSESLEVANSALGVEPEDGTANRLRALALESLGHYTESLVAALEAQRIEPHESISHAIVARTQRRLGRFPEAEAAARKAIELAPNATEGHLQLAWVLLERQDFHGSRESARRALRIDPDVADARNVLGVLDQLDRVESAARVHFLAAARSDLRDQAGSKNFADSVFRGSCVQIAVWRMLVWPLSLGFGLGAFGVVGMVVAIVLVVLVQALLAEFRMRDLPSQTRSSLRSHRLDRWRPSKFKRHLRPQNVAVRIASSVRGGWAGAFVAMWLLQVICFYCGWLIGFIAR